MDNLRGRVLDLMWDFERTGAMSVTCDTLAKSLNVSRSATLQVLQELIVAGKVEYARKNPRSTQPRFMLSGGR